MTIMDRTAWFAERGWGVFVHYLVPVETTAEDWNRRVDGFDVQGLARQLDEVGAGYFFLTIGQGSGHYCAPNDTYDEITGLTPSKCSRRDLPGDLYQALASRGIDLMMYAPADGSWADQVARVGLQMPHHWNDGPGYDWGQSRLVDFQSNWEACLRDWSLRWGDKVRGWWVDGCYHKEIRYPIDQPPNLETMAAALRAGNPDAILALNPGVLTPVINYSLHEDFTAGEVAQALPECPGPWVESEGHRDRYHLLSYLGERWCGSRVRFPDALVTAYTEYIISRGGVMTWDVPTDERGLIPDGFVRQLGAIGKGVRSMR